MLQEFSIEQGYYTPQDLQNKFGITLSTQSRMRMRKNQAKDKNPLPYIAIGKRILYIASDIEQWLRAKRDENTPQKN